MASRKEIREEVIRIADLNTTQHSTLMNDCINATLQEIGNPGWAYSRRNELHHNWSWLKRKTTFTTVSSQEDYILGSDVANIAIMRYGDPDVKLQKISDHRFYKYVPSPDDKGDPELYRQWQISGTSTALAVASKIDVVSTSSSDSGDADLMVTVWGYSSGVLVSESYTLNGATTVSGTVIFDAREIFVSKLKNTTGTVTIIRNTGTVTLASLGSQERNPIHPVISLYPIPSGTKTIYIHYYSFVRPLNFDSDTPCFGDQWHYVVRLGTLAKAYQYLNKEVSFQATMNLYSSAVRAMVAEDRDDPGYIPNLEKRDPLKTNFWLKRSSDAIA
jgi:hypothetical protein